MRVLVVEDDRALGLFLQKGLRLAGHVVDWVGDGEAALKHAAESRPELMVLDLSLPGKDGLQVLAEIRGVYDRMAVLVLTGRVDLASRVQCLELGADDCLLKPFSFRELTARCDALARRREQYADPMLRHQGVALHRMDRSVTRDGYRVDLTATEFSLLEYLLLRRGECASREELLDAVWRSSPGANANVVDVYVNYVRKKLAAASPEGHTSASIIETVRGIGYRLAAQKKPSAGVMGMMQDALCRQTGLMA